MKINRSPDEGRISIPPAALEAGARASATRLGVDWDKCAEFVRHGWREDARAAFVAMVEHWPGAYKSDPALFGHKLILPLPQEGGDE